MAQLSWDEACLLDPSLNSLRSSIQTPDSVQTVSGLTNLSWKLNFKSKTTLLWRPVSHMTRSFNISRQQEFQVLQYLTTQTQGQSVNAILVNSHGLLVEWLDGNEVLSVDDSLLVELVGRLHDLDVSHLTFAPFQFTARIEHYWRQLIKSPYMTPQLRHLYQQLRSPPALSPLENCLCHFDVGAHNIIQTKSSYHLIDWEYSCLADPRIELAMLVEQSDGDVITLVSQYCQLRGIDDVEGWIDGVEAWQPRVRFIALLWYYIAHQHKESDEYLLNSQRLLESLCRSDHCLLHENNQ
ncbi:phosphotransferase [Vibrio sp. WJH972]